MYRDCEPEKIIEQRITIEGTQIRKYLKNNKTEIRPWEGEDRNTEPAGISKKYKYGEIREKIW